MNPIISFLCLGLALNALAPFSIPTVVPPQAQQPTKTWDITLHCVRINEKNPVSSCDPYGCTNQKSLFFSREYTWTGSEDTVIEVAKYLCWKSQ